MNRSTTKIEKSKGKKKNFSSAGLNVSHMTTIVKNLVLEDTFMSKYQRENVNNELTLAVISVQTGRQRKLDPVLIQETSHRHLKRGSFQSWDHRELTFRC